MNIPLSTIAPIAFGAVFASISAVDDSIIKVIGQTGLSGVVMYFLMRYALKDNRITHHKLDTLNSTIYEFAAAQDRASRVRLLALINSPDANPNVKIEAHEMLQTMTDTINRSNRVRSMSETAPPFKVM